MTDSFDDIIDSIDEGGGSDPEAAPEESREDAMTRYFAALGYRPKTPKDKNTYEFAKVYTDASGRVARVVSVVKKDNVGLEPECAEYFTITVQIHVPASELDVERKAAAVYKPDLLRILAHFATPSLRREVQTSVCADCGTTSADVVDVGGEDICMDCARRRGA